MKKLLFIISTVILFGACQTDAPKTETKTGDSSLVEQIAQLEKETASNAVPEKVAQLKATYVTYLKSLSDDLTDTATGRIKPDIADQFMKISELFSLKYADDPKSPQYLHKAAEIARSTRAFSKAVKLYDRIGSAYPQSEKAAQALFMKAFTFDNELKQKDKAKELYEEFLSKYPNDEFADDTKFLLQNLNKSNEEIIKSFGN